MTSTSKTARTEASIDAATDPEAAHAPEAADAGNSASRAEARNGATFWQGAVAPIEALLPPGVPPTRLRQMPVSTRRGYVRAVRGAASPRDAIKAFCGECCGYDRDAVATCPAIGCPLWRYRPWQSGDDQEPTP